MVFSSPTFLFLFLPAVLVATWIARQNMRRFVLLGASLVFYAWGVQTFVGVIILSTLLDWLLALGIARSLAGGNRNVNVFTAACWRPISLMMSDRAGQPARWQTAAGAQPGALRTTQATTTVGLRSPSADRSDLPRLFRFPIQAFPTDPGTAAVAVDLTQTPGSGDPIPCLTPQQVVEGGALFVPLPAGRSAADLSVDVKAPVGTVLGRPEEIILDGATAPRKKK